MRYPWAEEYRGRRDGRLRPHARPHGRVGQQHHLPRHRRRVRRVRSPPCATRSGSSSRSRPSSSGTSRSGRSAPRPVPARRPCCGSTTSPAPGGSRPPTPAGSRSRRRTPPAALEVMSRFAVDPRWLVYLPPTMSPAARLDAGRLPRAPRAGVRGVRGGGVTRVVCEEKHMGSRAIAVVARDAEVAERRFGVGDGSTGALYTRTGRPFFPDTDRARRRAAPAPRSRLFDVARRPTGSPWTASCCPGRPRPWT